MPDGTRVKKGDLLVELDDSQRVKALNTLKVEIEELKASALVSAEQTGSAADPSIGEHVGEFELEVAKLRARQVEAEVKVERIVVEAEVSLARKTLDLLLARQQRIDEQFESGKTSEEEVQGVALEVAKAETALNVAVAEQKLLTEIVQPLRLAEMKLELVRAKRELDHAKREAKLQSEQTRAERDAIRAHVRLKADQMARLEEQIAKCKIFAPSSGVVRIGQPSIIREGATVRQGQRLIYLELESAPAR